MFLLDANVFINASRLYYSPDIAPTFWQWLAAEHIKGNIGSIVRVRQEIDDGTAGPLKTWAAGLPASFWLSPDSHAPSSMAQLAAWTTDPARQYTQAARAEFLSVADYFLVAQAHAGGHKVITFELPAPQSKKRVLIPDACSAMNVPYREPFGLYRQLGLHFS